MRAFVLIAILATTMLAGCTGEDPVLRIAFVQPDDTLEPAKDPERLADAIEAETGRKTTVYFVESTELALQAVASGQADAAFVDGAAGWFGWQRFGLEAAAATLESDGRTHYVASAWVLADSSYQTAEDLRGADSCHTGLMKSAGTWMPLGWLVANDYVAREGPDELSSIVPTLDAFFGNVNMPPSDADVYGNYAGALRCLSDGTGDVAFGKDTTPDTFCGANAQSWCLDRAQYRKLVEFGQVPSHPVMVGDIPAEKRADLVEALVALTATMEGKAVLQDVLGSRGFVAVDGSEGHLADYGQAIQHVPGLAKYVEDQVQ